MRIPLDLDVRSAPIQPEVGLDFPREWIEFAHPAEEAHVVRADLTWLLSRWTCIFGSGCHGIVEDRAHEGCCSHGAFFSDDADRKRVRKAALKLTRQTWQHYRKTFKAATDTEELRGEPATRTATRPDGPCVFHNDAGFAGGGGCALHAQALRDGVHPLRYKPDVCWQLPISLEQQVTNRPDESEITISILGEHDRRRWGAGGHDLVWWCTSSPEAHVAPTPLYQSYRAEITAMIGEACYAALAQFCDARLASGAAVVAHPASTRA